MSDIEMKGWNQLARLKIPYDYIISMQGGSITNNVATLWTIFKLNDALLCSEIGNI
jgi:hypothetical protein